MKPSILLLSGLLALSALAFAQSPYSPTATMRASLTSDGWPIIIRKNVDEVHLTFTATDEKNRAVRDLARAEVSVLEDGRPVEVLGFRQDADLPLRVTLLVDTSDSTRKRLLLEKQAGLEFMRRVLRAEDRALVGSFATKVKLAKEFSGDINVLASDVKAIEPTEGLTSFYDALFAACERMKLQDSNLLARRVLVVLSDGEDTLSRYWIDDVVQAAQRADVAVYAIGIGVHPSAQGGEAMRRVADATGGRAFFPRRVKQLPRVLKTIEQELRSQYAIAYRPVREPDGQYHSVRVLLHLDKVVARSRSGYWAPMP